MYDDLGAQRSSQVPRRNLDGRSNDLVGQFAPSASFGIDTDTLRTERKSHRSGTRGSQKYSNQFFGHGFSGRVHTQAKLSRIARNLSQRRRICRRCDGNCGHYDKHGLGGPVGLHVFFHDSGDAFHKCTFDGHASKSSYNKSPSSGRHVLVFWPTEYASRLGRIAQIDAHKSTCKSQIHAHESDSNKSQWSRRYANFQRQ